LNASPEAAEAVTGSGDDAGTGLKPGANETNTARLTPHASDHPDSTDNLDVLRDIYGDTWPLLTVSAEREDNLDTFARTLYEMLDRVRVYTKTPGKKPDLTAPYTLPRGSTVVDVAGMVHKDFAEQLKYARIWGTDKYDGQMVQRDYIVQDEDVIELHT
jgi:ribosome-interacting GTPase 1